MQLRSHVKLLELKEYTLVDWALSVEVLNFDLFPSLAASLHSMCNECICPPIFGMSKKHGEEFHNSLWFVDEEGLTGILIVCCLHSRSTIWLLQVE